MTMRQPKIEVWLSPAEHMALVRLAQQECRLPGDQLRYLLRKELHRAPAPSEEECTYVQHATAQP